MKRSTRWMLWGASSLVGLALANVDIGMELDPKWLLMEGRSGVGIIMMLIWIGTAWLVDKPRWLGWLYPGAASFLFLWAYVGFAYIGV